jgi:flagellar protein FlgJ
MSFSAEIVPLDMLKPMASAASASANALKSAAAANDPATAAKRAAIKKAAKDFEASFLSTTLASVFKDVTTSAPFGGGEGEDAFKSFLNDAFAKQMVKAGGIGIAAPVQREMLRLQGLS